MSKQKNKIDDTPRLYYKEYTLAENVYFSQKHNNLLNFHFLVILLVPFESKMH